ncbi:MAG TPA: NADH-quinone oxidoreductase subunit M, partial [Actinomycetota bacterium]|nr:NADH-quinone oxidoreductase subunit M [Actinomycetota bacterium]
MAVTTLLLLTLLAPAVGAVVASLVPHDRTGRILATVFAGLAFVASAALLLGHTDGWFAYTSGPPVIRPWVQVDLTWVPALDLSFHVGVDGISYPLVVLTTLLTLLCCGYTCWHVPASTAAGRHLAALLLVIEVGIVGVFLALDLVLFFVFFEIVLLPMYAVIAVWGGENRRHAARKFVLYTLFGSVLLLVGVFTVVAAAGTADLVKLSSGAGAALPYSVQLSAFVLLAVAFAVKSPLWPLHTWLPDAHTEAPTVGSVVLAGVLLKMGTYGLLRVAVGVVPDGAATAAPVLGVLAVAAILIGGLVCLAQTELKRLIAYSSVGHMGFVLLGIATLTATGFQAALIGNVAHGIITGLLFFLVGAVKDRAHTGSLTDLGGLRENAPALSGLLGYAAIASLGLPGLAGFWGEAFAVVASFRRGGPLWIVLGILAAVGAALAAAYFLRMLRRVTHGPAAPAV